MTEILKPIKRSGLRLKLGSMYYCVYRKILWLGMNKEFASVYQSKRLEFLCFSHKTLLLRRLKDVEMKLQYNKIINLRIAAKKVNGILIRPGEIFSYWKLIGKPTKAKGYVDGMILENGTFRAGTGGGLCQLSNLLFWMALHTPLTVIERHRHEYDVFPDSNRTQPFGSGATCFYPYIDLMIKNETQMTYQLNVTVGNEFLEGELRVSSPPEHTFKIIERNHVIKNEYWGGYSRHNELYRLKYDMEGNMLDETVIIKNHAIMMYSPFLPASTAL